MTSKVLNNSQVCELVAEFQKSDTVGGDTSLEELASWAKPNFQLGRTPHVSTISRILKQAGNIDSNRCRPIKHPEIEKALVDWIWSMFTQVSFVSDEMIKTKAFMLLNEANSLNSVVSKKQMQLSNGWLFKFKARNDFKGFNSPGESLMSV